MRHFVKRLISAPVYVINSPFLNRLGIQNIRIKFKLITKSKKVNLIDPLMDRAIKDLDENGITTIENFLSKEEFDIFSKTQKSIEGASFMKHEVGKEGGKVEWSHCNIPSMYCEIIENKFRKNKDLI